MKDIQKLKKQLLMEELRRQGKAPKTGRWLLLALGVVVLAAAGGFWYRSNLEALLEKRFQGAVAARHAGQYQQAVDAFRQLYREHPRFEHIPDALYQAAEIQDLFLARYEDALLTYLLLERDYPDAEQVPAAQQQVAVLYKYRLNDCTQAIVAYQKVLDRNDDGNDQLHYEIADCYFRLNNFEQARIEFEGLIKGYPGSALAPEVQYRIAVTYALEGKLPEAVGAYRQVIEHWSDSPYAVEARFGLATVLEEQEKLLDSLAILEGLVGVYPNPEILEKKTAQVRERIGKKKDAI